MINNSYIEDETYGDDNDDNYNEAMYDDDDENGGYSSEQEWDQEAIEINEILQKIDDQTSKINPEIDTKDWIEVFLVKYLKLDLNGLEDRSIYIDPSLKDQDRGVLHYFSDKLAIIFETNYGITFNEPDIYLLYCIYKTFYLQFINTILFYINGLQLLNEDFIDDVPNWNELSYDYFANKVYSGTDSIYSKLRSYIDYILNSGLILEEFFTIALLESEGNVTLSALYLEATNFRLNFDFFFFKEKIAKMTASDSITDGIIDRMVTLRDIQ